MDDILEFDRPFFKVLSHNDSGASKGHQGGVVIPKVFDSYFPRLTGKITSKRPTSGKNIKAILVVGGKKIGTVTTRFQYQSWGGGRTQERRITGNLGLLRSKSVKDDMLLIERSLTDHMLYRLTLLKKASEPCKAIRKAAAGKRWGAANPLDPPVSDKELADAEREQKRHEAKKFSLFDNEAALTEFISRRVARSRAFQKLTTNYYSGKCCVCGLGFVSLAGESEVEAAHIVPRSKRGADDARNGLSLCRSHHWAFDKGIWGVKANGLIVVAQVALGKGSNNLLKRFVSKRLLPPKPAFKAPAAEALAWHFANVFSRKTGVRSLALKTR